MKGRDFIRLIRKAGRVRGVAVRVDSMRGKGSHVTLYYGDRLTVVKSGDIPKGLLHAMMKQLGLRIDDVR
jgi:mRNA interferase HicA